MTSFDSVPILGVPIHNVDMTGAVDRIVELVDASRRTGHTHQVVTVNTDFLVRAQRDDDVHEILQRADLAIADGMPVVWASKLMGAGLPARVAGADLVPALVARAARSDLRIMFFGGAGDSAAIAAERLRREYHGADIVSATGTVSPDGSTDESQLRQLREAAPDVLCVGLGHPKQERFIARHSAALGVPVSIGTGATFEFICGDTVRAPEWMQRAGLEWLHRMVKDPARLVRRYATDARVFAPALRAQMRNLGGRAGRRAAPRIPAPGGQVPLESLDVTGIHRIGPADATHLSSHATLARRRGAVIELHGASLGLLAQLDRLQLRALFRFSPQSSTKVTPS